MLLSQKKRYGEETQHMNVRGEIPLILIHGQELNKR